MVGEAVSSPEDDVRGMKQALVLNQADKPGGAYAPQRIGVAKFMLDNAFVVIEGHLPPAHPRTDRAPPPRQDAPGDGNN